MIRQMLTLCWNRKRAHVLIVSEVFFSFLVVFAVMTMGLYGITNYRRTLGYDARNVLDVTLVSINSSLETVFKPGDRALETQGLLREVSRLDGVEAAAGLSNPLYYISASSEHVEYGGRATEASYSDATDDLDTVLRLNITRGRWFEPADEALDYDPVVINEHLRHTLFGTGDPIGQRISPSDHGPREERVIGVLDEFREDGELSGSEDYLFKRQRLSGPDAAPILNLVVRVRPGASIGLEERLLTRLRALSPSRTFQVDSVATMRHGFLRLRLIPMAALGLIAAFMLLMVGLGMVGVLWQSVSRRRREIGLRRALGATGRGVSLQVLGELLVVTSAGVLLGCILAVQIPLLGIMVWVGGAVYAAATALSAALIYVLTIGAALYPSRLAAQVQPAEALHYE